MLAGRWRWCWEGGGEEGMGRGWGGVVVGGADKMEGENHADFKDVLE